MRAAGNSGRHPQQQQQQRKQTQRRPKPTLSGRSFEIWIRDASVAFLLRPRRPAELCTGGVCSSRALIL